MSRDAKPAIRIGIGGWTSEPWRRVFHPEGLARKRELDYASGKLTSIEANGTFCRSQKPETFAKWHDETPADFVFALKGPRNVFRYVISGHKVRNPTAAMALIERLKSG